MNNEIKKSFETSINYLEALNKRYLLTLSSCNIFKNFNNQGCDAVKIKHG